MMKTLSRSVFLGSLMVLAIVMVGCNSGMKVTNPSDGTPVPTVKGLTLADEYPIYAGQSIIAGSIKIANDENNVFITYETTEPWLLTETHVHVSATVAGIPVNRPGNPIPGQFAYGNTHDPMVTTYTVTYPFNSNGFTYGDDIVIAAHCVVKRLSNDEITWVSETGWGGNIPGPTGNRWWYYLVYELKEPPVDEVGDYDFETATLRMYDLSTDTTYPMPGANWFTYVKHIPIATPQVFYLYAGQHTRVGVANIWKAENKLKVEIVYDIGYFMNESHLDVKVGAYVTSLSPGQAAFKVKFDPVVNSYLYEVTWLPAWDNQELSIFLHTVVGPF